MPKAFNERFAAGLARYYAIKDLARPPDRKAPMGYRVWAETGKRRATQSAPASDASPAQLDQPDRAKAPLPNDRGVPDARAKPKPPKATGE